MGVFLGANRYVIWPDANVRTERGTLWCGRAVRGRSYICRENSRFQRGYCETFDEVNLEICFFNTNTILTLLNF